MKAIKYVVCFFLLLQILAKPVNADPAIKLFAAASTVELIRDLASRWEALHKQNVRTVFGSSGALARQIALGAPADLFFSAAKLWVTYLIQNQYAVKNSRRTVATNRLVLIASSGYKPGQKFNPANDILSMLGTRNRLAIADPSHVPAGQYARELLQNLNIWNKVKQRTARTQNVRLALALVERKEAPFGIVYKSDIHRRKRVENLYTFSETLHSPIEYQIAEMTHATKGAREFLKFLNSSDGYKIMEQNGFKPVRN